MESGILTRSEAAAYLKISMKTLDISGIPRVRFGRVVRYTREAMDSWLSERLSVPIRYGVAQRVLSLPKPTMRKPKEAKADTWARDRLLALAG